MARPDSKRTPDAKLKAIHLRNARNAKYQTTKVKVSK
jgi:hypothetical protein